MSSPVFSSPAFHEGHSDGAHSRQLINSFKALGNALGQQIRKLVIVENFQIATWRYLANRGRMPTIALIAIWALNEYGAV